MISDKVVKVKTTEGDFEITITGQQIGQTVSRRIAQLMPRARVLDMVEKDGEQGDLLRKGK